MNNFSVGKGYLLFNSKNILFTKVRGNQYPRITLIIYNRCSDIIMKYACWTSCDRICVGGPVLLSLYQIKLSIATWHQLSIVFKLNVFPKSSLWWINKHSKIEYIYMFKIHVCGCILSGIGHYVASCCIYMVLYLSYLRCK